jgi:hypothetical protein
MINEDMERQPAKTKTCQVCLNLLNWQDVKAHLTGLIYDVRLLQLFV